MLVCEINGAGFVRSTDAFTFNCGKAWPKLPEKKLDQAPAAHTTA